MIVLLLFWILYCLAEGYEHARYPVIYHFRASLRRIATGLVVGYSVTGVGGPLYLYIDVGLLLAMTFWIFFDIARNLASGESAFYIGATASLDKILAKAPLTTWIARFFLFAVAVVANWFVMNEYSIQVTHLINNTWLF